jgi:hypothetical protein
MAVTDRCLAHEDFEPPEMDPGDELKRQILEAELIQIRAAHYRMKVQASVNAEIGNEEAAEAARREQERLYKLAVAYAARLNALASPDGKVSAAGNASRHTAP